MLSRPIFLGLSSDTLGKRLVFGSVIGPTPMASADCWVADVFACLGWCGAFCLAGTTHRCERGVDPGCRPGHFRGRFSRRRSSHAHRAYRSRLKYRFNDLVQRCHRGAVREWVFCRRISGDPFCPDHQHLSSLVGRLDRRHAKKETAEHTIEDSIQLVCRGRQESRVRTLLIQLLTLSPLTLHEVESVVGQDDKNTVIKAIVKRCGTQRCPSRASNKQAIP